jgi:hypothetical protein
MEFTPEGRVKSNLNPDTTIPNSVSELVQQAIEKFREDFKHRSFSQRNPDLGKMVNCQVCNLRHRSSQICHQRHVVELVPPDGLTELTKFQVLGRKQFSGKRINPHYSKKRIQLVQRTIELYPLHDGIWPGGHGLTPEVMAMHMARREALEGLQRERNERRSQKTSAQHRSRRINRGLLQGNARVHR